MPDNFFVIVSAERGLYADWLYQEITNLGWHPFLRINHQGYYRRENTGEWQPLVTILIDKNQSWSGQVTCFQKNSLTGTLWAHWGEDYIDPGLILTDLNPGQANVSWYQLRYWI